MKNFSKILLCFFLIGTFASVSFAQDTGDENTPDKTSVVLIQSDYSEIVTPASIEIVAPPGEYVDELVKTFEDGTSAYAPAIPDYDGRLPECDQIPYHRSHKLDLFSVLNKPPLDWRICLAYNKNRDLNFKPKEMKLPYSRHVQA